MENLTEDEMLIRAMEESLRHYEEVERPRRLMEVDEAATPISTGAEVTAESVKDTKPSRISWSNTTGITPLIHRDSLKQSLSNTVPKSAPTDLNFKSLKEDIKPGPSRVNTDTLRAVTSPSRVSIGSFTSTSSVAKPGPSQQSKSLSGLWQVWGAKITVTNHNQEIQDEPVEPNSDDPLQLISEAKILTDGGFCMLTGRHWVYPTNYPERKYQLDMVQTALFHNTLVCLPTGLGKTFIAAVVMFNFYRWYPQGKIIFMAPTKPLVAQQIKACYDITGIPKEHTEELTGTMNAERRSLAWKQKRLFFATPQVVANDLVAHICPAKEVRCIVVDEAHRAQGDFAYCQVVSILRSYITTFRLLALSATPGTDINAVKQVLMNLHISKLKIATENSPEVAQYTHHREVEIITVASSPELNYAKDCFQNIMGNYLQPLIQNNIVSGFNIANLTQFQMKTSLDKLSRTPPSWLSGSELARMQSLCLTCITLCHAQELLQYYGLRSFLSYIQGVLQDDKTNKIIIRFLSKDENLLSMIDELNLKLNGKAKKDGEPSNSVTPKIMYGHPKLQKLQEIIVEHFLEYEERNETTRAIVFCQYRDSVEEIKNMLKQLEPIVKPLSFVGQAKSKGTLGLTQKQQLQVMRDFRSGNFNTLISTSVGEEGLDIGEVDLIVCMDASKSPIRLVQRMGRTGRKRSGKIIMLLSEGKEHKKYVDSTRKQSSISKNIINNQKLLSVLNQNRSPRMIPQGLTPIVYRTVLVIPKEAKEQDIRKALRKTTALIDFAPALPSSADLASWDGQVPEFNHLESIYNSELLTFQSVGSIFNNPPDFMVNKKTTSLDLHEYLEWQRSLQGIDSAPHSKDSIALVALLQLADRLTLNNPELLTQTADLVSEVDHDALWNTMKGKGRGRGKRGRTTKERPGPRRGDIAWCLAQQKQINIRRPASPAPSTLSDDDIFELLAEQEPRKTETVAPLSAKITEALDKLSIKEKVVNLGNPLYKTFQYISIASDILRKVKNKYNKPDLSVSPPDVSLIDTILADLKIEVQQQKSLMEQVIEVKYQPKIEEDYSPERMQQIAILTQQSAILGKRNLSQREPANTVKDDRVVRTNKNILQSITSEILLKSAIPIVASHRSEYKKTRNEFSDQRFSMTHRTDVNDISLSDKNKSFVGQPIKISGSPKSQVKIVKPTSHEISQGMNDFLMDFDLGCDYDCLLSVDSDVHTKNSISIPISKVPEIEYTYEMKCDKINSKPQDSLETNNNETKSDAFAEKYIIEEKSPDVNTTVALDSKSRKLDVEVLHEDDDVFDDVDLFQWLEELEKRGIDTQIQGTEVPVPLQLISSETSISPPVSSSKAKSFPVPPSSNPKVFPILHSSNPETCHILHNSRSAETSPASSKSLASTVKVTPSLASSSNAEPCSPDIFSPSFDTHNKANVKIFSNDSIKESSSKDITIFNKYSPIANVSRNGASPNMFSSSSSSTPSPKIHIKVDHIKENKTEITLKPLPIEQKVPSKLSLKNELKSVTVTQVTKNHHILCEPKVPVHNKSNAFEDDSFMITSKRKSSEMRQGIIVSSDEDSPQITSRQDQAKRRSSDTRNKISSNESSPKVKVLQKEKDNTEFLSITISSSSEGEQSSDDRSSLQLIRLSSDSDDEFVRNRFVGKRKSQERHKEKVKKQRKEVKAQAFLDLEAEVSGEDSADDVDDSHLDRYDASFINTQATQADPSVDMKAQYLRSVRSPIHGHGRFKIPQLHHYDRGKLWSPRNDDSSYMNDSFCVESCDEENASDSDAELEELEAKLENKKVITKRHRHDISSQDEEEVKKAAKGKKLRRIIQHSSSDEETQQSPLTNLEMKDKSAPRSLQKDSPLLPVPLASSTPNVVKGFEGDYIDDDEDLDKIIACINISQEIERTKQHTTKPTSSRSLFKVKDDEESTSESIANKISDTNRNKPTDINSPSCSTDRSSVFRREPIICAPSEENQLKLPIANVKKKLSLAKPSILYKPNVYTKFSSLFENPPKLSDPTQDCETPVVQPIISKLTLFATKDAETSNAADIKSEQSLSGNPVIITSTRQVVSAPKLLTMLRHTHKVDIRIQTLPLGVDYVVSQRLAVGRMQIQVPEPKKHPSKHISTGSRSLRMAMCLMRQVSGLKFVFAKDQGETASIIQKLALKEHRWKYNIKQYYNEYSDPAFDARLKFFSALPGVNIALALKLVHQYPLITDFIKSCSTVESIEKNLDMNRKQASAVYQVLCRPLQ